MGNLTFRKSSYSGGSNNCVEVAESAAGAAMRDTKHRDLGTLTFPTREWRALLGASKLQEPS
ncbi:protein of unknown function [Nocardiopsis flavescens]|uniref:DUF397 domain-containing protein n=1 Tax=Nocardiopsis flavescens TaxID=758803 RepID=A0A1M6QGJ7_9ACTN|nr:DUF397 domain-containing protein [Nocardiopsis flavescens]SHK19193.1 protein of unknown function [Nocardiopsis flavescens]